MKKLLILGMLTSLVTAANAYTDRYNSQYNTQSSNRTNYYNSSNTNLNPNTGPEMLKKNNFSANFKRTNINNQDRIGSRTDRKLLEEIRAELNDRLSPSQFQFVTLQLNNGRVVLFGTVDTMNDSHAIEGIVSNIRGVKGVTNQLAVNEANGMMTQPATYSPSNAANTGFASQIRQAIVNSGNAEFLDTINFTVNGGIVTLTGLVPNRNIKNGIERTIYRINGVTQVNNFLTVDNNMNGNRTRGKTQAYSKFGTGLSDSQLADTINSELKSGWFTGGFKNVQITVNKGIVTLDGTVKSSTLKRNAEKTVSEIDGVQSVINNLRIAN